MVLSLGHSRWRSLGHSRWRRAALVALALLAALPAWAQTAAEPDYDALYRQLFGHAPPDIHHRLDADLRIDSRRFGSVVVLSPVHGSQIRVEAKGLLDALGEILLEEPLERVAAAVDADGYITADRLRELGIESGFSERRLRLELETPLEQRRVTVLSLHLGRRHPGQSIAPATLSAYLNTFTRADFRRRRSHIHENLAGAVNYRGWVLRTAADFDNRSSQVFELDALEVHRDDLERGLRYAAGSLQSLALPPSLSEGVVGIGVSSISTLRFYERPRPEITEEFELEQSAAVRVWINRSLVQVFQLRPGHYELRDFPLISGTNFIEIQAVDGDVELFRKQRSLTWEQQILRAGEHQISANAGVPLNGQDMTQLSHADTALASGLYRYGLNDRLSLGASTKLNRERRELVAGALIGGRYGLWDLGAGMSHFDGNALQGSAVVDFRNYAGLRWTSWLNSYGGSLRFDSPRFGQQTSEASRFIRALATSAYLGLRLGPNATANLRLFFDVNRGSWDNTVGTNLALRYAVTRELQLQLTTDWRRDSRGDSSWFVAFRFTHFPRSLGTRTQLDFMVPDYVTSVEWSHHNTAFDELKARLRYDDTDNNNARAELHQGDWHWGAGTRRSFGRQSAETDLLYSGGRGRFGARYSYQAEASSFVPAEHRGEIVANTAVAFADGQFALSQPVGDGFLILRPNPRFKRSRIRYSRNAVSDLLGPAVVSNLRPLQANTVSVLEADLPVGAWIPQRSHTLVPLPDTGYVITVGAGGGILVEGILLDSSGDVIAFDTGQVVALDDPETPPQPFFTGEDGGFTLLDLQPGRYRLELTSRGLSTALVIPDDAAEVYEVGVRVLEPRDAAADEAE